jgi:hypothetical protein
MVNRKIVNEFMETKKIYTAPEIELVELDNEISLALESSPPEGPGETGISNMSLERFNYQPLKDFVG